MFEKVKQKINTIEAIEKFEKECNNISHQYCPICMQVSLNLKVKDRRNETRSCDNCNTQKKYSPYSEIRLPTWKDENDMLQYQLPEELLHLREAEKLLIVQYLPYIPLQHLRKGQLGSKGHVCCCLQDVGEICKVLPRLPSSVQFLRVVRSFKDDYGEKCKKTFIVRKHAVLKAPQWLKKYSIVYKDIEIREDNLSWMNNNLEQEIPCMEVEEDESDVENNDDEGPAKQQVYGITEKEEYYETVSGLTFKQDEKNFMSDENLDISKSIQEAAETGSKQTKKDNLSIEESENKVVVSI